MSASKVNAPLLHPYPGLTIARDFRIISRVEVANKSSMMGCIYSECCAIKANQKNTEKIIIRPRKFIKIITFLLSLFLNSCIKYEHKSALILNNPYWNWRYLFIVQSDSYFRLHSRSFIMVPFLAKIWDSHFKNSAHTICERISDRRFSSLMFFVLKWIRF